MTKIVIRILLVLIILFSALMTLLSIVTGIDIWNTYKKQILIGISMFCGAIMALYMSLALLGIS